MSDTALHANAPSRSPSASSLMGGHRSRTTVIAVLIGIVVGLGYSALSLHHDVSSSAEPSGAFLPWSC